MPRERLQWDSYFQRFCKTCSAYLNNRDQMKNKRLTLEAEIRVVPAANEPGQWIPKGKIRRPRGLINCLMGGMDRGGIDFD